MAKIVSRENGAHTRPLARLVRRRFHRSVLGRTAAHEGHLAETRQGDIGDKGALSAQKARVFLATSLGCQRTWLRPRL